MHTPQEQPNPYEASQQSHTKKRGSYLPLVVLAIVLLSTAGASGFLLLKARTQQNKFQLDRKPVRAMPAPSIDERP